MKYSVFGGFEIKRNEKNPHGLFDKKFWEAVESNEEGLSSACGCYIFALKNGQNIRPWYVGKAERLCFKQECFSPQKRNYFNEVLVDHKGTALLILTARLTNSQRRFSKVASKSYRDVDFLESMLIGKALEKNANLLNVRKTKLLREIIVPGVINSPQGPPTGPERILKNAIGI